MDILLEEIKRGIGTRKREFKSDAYFDLPDDITIEQIKELQQKIDNDKIRCRLYTPKQLQVHWDFGARRNPIEVSLNIRAIHDINLQMKLFERTIGSNDHVK